MHKSTQTTEGFHIRIFCIKYFPVIKHGGPVADRAVHVRGVFRGRSLLVLRGRGGGGGRGALSGRARLTPRPTAGRSGRAGGCPPNTAACRPGAAATDHAGRRLAVTN